MLVRIFLALTVLACGYPPLRAAESLNSILARMDKDAAAFRNLSADLNMTTFTAVLDDTTKESGKAWIRRSGRNLEMRVEFAGTNPRSLHFEGNKGEIYYPKINTVQMYDLGKSRSLVDQFLLLGFGTSAKDLGKSYKIKVGGEEEVQGQNATWLELIPKSSEVLQYITSVRLWVPQTGGYPVQQKFFKPGGNFTLITYRDVKLNQNLSPATFKLNLPKDVQVERPQK